MDKINDFQILKLKKDIEDKIAEIGEIESYKYKTKCILYYNGYTNQGFQGRFVGSNSHYSPNVINHDYNLHQISDLETLLTLYSFIDSLSSNIKKYSDILLESDNIFKDIDIQGYKAEEWKSDIKYRIKKIQIEKKKIKLNLLKERLLKLMSTELKNKLEFDAIIKELNE